MFVERLHKKAIQAFKCFRWMLDGTNQWIGHFHLIPAGENQWKLSSVQRVSTYLCGLGCLCELNKAKRKWISDVGELLSFTVQAHGEASLRPGRIKC